MFKKLWVLFYYYLFFTFWLSIFSALGSDSTTSFYAAVLFGIVIDLIRVIKVPSELSGDGSWKMMKIKKVSDLWDIQENMLVSMPFITISYIWVICICDAFVEPPIMNFYFSLYDPLYTVMGHQFEFIRDHIHVLKMNGFEERALLAQHIYSIGMFVILSGIIWYACFRAHYLTVPLDSGDPHNSTGIIKELTLTILSLFFVVGIFGLFNEYDVDFAPRSRKYIPIHKGYIFFIFFYPGIILLLQYSLQIGFMAALSGRHKVMREFSAND